MKSPRFPLLAMAAAIVLAGCAAPAASPAPAAVGAASGLLAAAPADCKDGLEPNATLAPSASQTGAAVKKIKARGYLRVATNGDVLRWGATDTKTGEPQGYDVDLAAKIAQALGLNPAKTVYTVIPYSERQRVLANDQVDLVAQQMTITCSRWTGTAETADAAAQPAINLSVPYYTAGAKLLVSKDSAFASVADLKGQPVCGTTGSTSLAAVEQSGVTAVTAPSAGQCLVKFLEGDVAAVVGDETTLAGFLAQDSSSKIIGDAILPGQYGLGTQASATDFTTFVNATLLDLRDDGTLDQLYDKWMKPVVQGSAPNLPAPVYGRNVTALARTS